MRNYPNVGTLATEKLLEQIVEQRREDVREIEELQRLNGYQSGFFRKTTEINTDYSAGITDVYILGTAASGNITVTLIDAPTDGQTHYVKNDTDSANNVIVDGGAKNIDGAGTLTLTAGQKAHLVYFPVEDEWKSM